ncbi:MAG: hypothetical protein QNJ90_09980 [Planctomycetota bacterium]|nr:hypothetical protein [Planctomycetota bacterium]
MRIAAVLVLIFMLGACGGDDTPPGPGPLLPPADPEAALAWVEEVQDDGKRLRARLDVWPLSGEDFEYAEETQIAWTWRLQLALRDGDVERADTLQALLLERFDGRGQYPAGRELPLDAVRLGIFEEALLAARRRIEGVRPDVTAAQSALDVAGRMLVPDEKEDHERLAGTRAWIERTDVTELLATIGSKAPISDKVQATVVVIADDFALGEPLFFEVLKQWRDNHPEARFDRVCVPLLRGQVRFGLRLVPAESEEAELASIDKRCSEAGLAREKPLSVERLASLGMVTGEAALLLADGKGRIVARLSGRNIDPRVLEPALQRLLSR